MSLAKKSLGTLVSRVVKLFLRFPLGILIAQFLGPEGKGLLHLLFMSATICAAIGYLGQGPAAIYFIGKDRERLPAVLGNLLLVGGVISIILVSAGWLFLSYLRPDLYVQLPLYIWILMAFLVVITILHGFFNQVLSAVLRIKEINIIDVVRVVLDLTLFVLVVIIAGAGVEGAFFAHVLSDVLATGALFVLVLRYGGKPAKPDFALLVASLRFGMKSYLYNLENRMNLRLDAFLVASFAAGGVVATGIYSVAVNLAELILFIPVSIRLSLLPMVAARNPQEANRLTSMACRHTLFLSALVALAFVAVGPVIIPYVYGERFAGAVIPLFILLPGIILLSQARIMYSDLVGRGKPGVSTVCAASGMVATVILDLILIPRYGIIGAAIASTSAYTLEFVVAGIWFIHVSGLPWKEVLVIRSGDLLRYQSLFFNRIRYLKRSHQL